MRIVYDDQHMDGLRHLFGDIADTLRKQWPGGRSDLHRGKGFLHIVDAFDTALHEAGFFLWREAVTHANNIGNNNRYPVIYRDQETCEAQVCGYLNVNDGIYGEVTIYLSTLLYKGESPHYVFRFE